MRILLLGKIGQLGWEFMRTLPYLGELAAFDYPEIDFSKPENLRALVRQVRPQVIVNAAAYTAVDRAESEVELCRLINEQAPAVLAQEAAEIGAAFIHFSTDYVFDGAKGVVYDEEDLPHPLNAYGQSKFAGEQRVINTGGSNWIFRTSWVYSLRRDSFVTKVLEWGRRQKNLRIVADQVGCPTWSRALAEITTLALSQGRQDPVGWVGQTAGLYHLAGSGWASRLEWAREILRLDPRKNEQVVEEILPATTAEFPTPARRPLYVPLDCSRFTRTFNLALPKWQQVLELAMAE